MSNFFDGVGIGGPRITGPTGGSAPGAGSNDESRKAAREVAFLEKRLDRAVLVNLALWSLIQDKLGLTEEDLLSRVRVLDEMDGKADGKAAADRVAPCHACKRPVSQRQDKCMYCGAEKRVSSAFDLL
ncbi:MAG: hypothetical protein AAF288_13480 [Planctomycetota bacterium]